MSLKHKWLVLVCAFLLLLSFGVHLVEFHHEHPTAIFGDGISAFLHGEDKKFFRNIPTVPLQFETEVFNFAVLLFSLLFLFSNARLFNRRALLCPASSLCVAFQRGIVHPKVY